MCTGPRRFWKLGRYRIPLDRASVELRRKSQPFWNILGDHHIGCTVLRVPITFPAGKVQRQAALRHVHAGSERHARQLLALHHPRRKARLTPAAVRYPLTRAGEAFEGSLEGPENSSWIDGGPAADSVPSNSRRAARRGAPSRIQGERLELTSGDYSRVGPADLPQPRSG